MRGKILSIVALAVASGCSSNNITGTDGINLSAAKQKWAARRVHDYSYTLALQCECAGPSTTRITVKSDTVRSVTDQSGLAVTGEGRALSVDSLFNIIAKGLRAGTPVEATYDGELGFPTNIIYDGPAMPVDGGVIYTISGFQPLIVAVDQR